jgi:hypothetical protein
LNFEQKTQETQKAPKTAVFGFLEKTMVFSNTALKQNSKKLITTKN